MVEHNVVQSNTEETSLTPSIIEGGRKRRRHTKGKHSKGTHSKGKHSKGRHGKSKHAKTKKGKRPASKWIIFVKKFSVKNGKSYRDALKDPRCKLEYHKSK